jgi:hypothetical protein
MTNIGVGCLCLANFAAVENRREIQPVSIHTLLCLVILSAFFARRTYAVGRQPLRWMEGMAVLLKRDITLSSLQRAAALVGRRVVIELV